MNAGVIMRKRILVIIPVAVVLALASTLILINNRQTPAWKTKLDQYLAYMRTTGQATYRLIAYSTASQPGNFTPEMSAESFSDSVIFQTTTNTSAQYFAGLQLMPYPPEEVVCVLLDGGRSPELVYVTRHSSLYNADWIVHISTDPWNSLNLQSSLASIGCNVSE